MLQAAGDGAEAQVAKANGAVRKKKRAFVAEIFSNPQFLWVRI